MELKKDSIIYPLPDDDLIDSFEEYCEVELPDAFREFLKENNGIVPKTNVFSYNGVEYLLERFLCLLENPELDEEYGWYDIEVVLSQLSSRLTDDDELVGAELIPFGTLFAGDYVCLDYRNEDECSICVWLHEESDIFKPVTITIAESFSEFLNMLSE